MTATERRAAFSLAAVYFMRMLGLFLILPVFAVYAGDLEGATTTLAGLAIGIYGLTQAALQIPFGVASDRFGRKPLILFGLVLFAAGSVLAALSDHIVGVIIGRAIQGAGAIASVVMALNADLTREENRTKAMALVGMSIGMAFFIALLAGPMLTQWIGVSGLFWLTAGFAVAGMLLIRFVVPNPVQSTRHREAQPIPEQLLGMLANRELQRLDFGIFALHAALTALFIGVPLTLVELGVPLELHWQLYLPVLVLSVATMVPFVIVAERKRRMKPVFLGAIAAVALGAVGLSLAHGGIVVIGVWLWVFFSAFNVLEASLPSLVSKVAPPDAKGSAMGIYSSSQFLGAFSGGVAGGWVHQNHGATATFLLVAALAAAWLVFALGMRPPAHLTSRLLKVEVGDDVQARLLGERLTGVRGVAEAVVLADEGIAYLKVDRRDLDEAALRACVG